MEAQPDQTKQFSSQLAGANIILGVMAIAPLLISLVGSLLGLIFHINQ